MSASDEALSAYTHTLEIDNDVLRVELELAKQEMANLKVEILRLFADREYCP